VKILERKAAMLGLDTPQKFDLAQVQAQEAPQGHDRIFEMIMRIKHGPDWQPGNGNGSDPAAGDGGDR
jgi:hypothetical protein